MAAPSEQVGTNSAPAAVGPRTVLAVAGNVSPLTFSFGVSAPEPARYACFPPSLSPPLFITHNVSPGGHLTSLASVSQAELQDAQDPSQLGQLTPRKCSRGSGLRWRNRPKWWLSSDDGKTQQADQTLAGTWEAVLQVFVWRANGGGFHRPLVPGFIVVMSLIGKKQHTI